jgi:glycyl-tRNA synthetase
MIINDQQKFQAIISHAKEYGFVFQSSEIYDGLSAVYDYGPWGSELKKNIRESWWNEMTRMHDNIVGIDAAIFMHPTTWKASGHVDNFSDPMVDNKDSKKRYRVDHLIEGFAEALAKEGKTADAEQLLSEMDALLANSDYEGLKKLIEGRNMKCAVSGTCNWTDVRQFNLMFSTQLGSVAEESNEIYLRPETAQGIFVNFLNVQKTARMKIHSVSPRWERPSATKSLPVSSFSGCVNLNKWRCSFSSVPAHKKSGTPIGKKNA